MVSPLSATFPSSPWKIAHGNLADGGSRMRNVALVAAEVISVIVAGGLFAAMMSLATSWVATSATRLLVKLT